METATFLNFKIKIAPTTSPASVEKPRRVGVLLVSPQDKGCRSQPNSCTDDALVKHANFFAACAVTRRVERLCYDAELAGRREVSKQTRNAPPSADGA